MAQEHVNLHAQDLVAAVKAFQAEQSQEHNRALSLALTDPAVRFLLPLGEDGKRIMMLNSPDGRRFFPAYTSGAEAQKNKLLTKKSRAIAATLERYGELLEQNESVSGLIIDPQGLNFPLPRETVLKLRLPKLDNSRVLDAIAAWKEDKSQENSVQITLALLEDETQFLLPMGADGKGILMLKNAEGQQFLAAYTSQEEARKDPSVTGESRLLPLNLAGYSAMLEKTEAISGLVIDPRSANFALSREMVLKLKAQKEARDKLPKGPMKVLTPKETIQNDMTRAVGKELYKILEVDSCYLRITQRGEGEEAVRGWLFVVEYYGEDYAGVCRTIFDTCKPFLNPEDTRVEFTQLDSELGQQVTQQGDPFFRRQMLWV
ncbi:MAG: SseB family protein [Clostridiales bacterium]|nr:SseB family protein [Clostridiales bacterium]